jgi:hypothetical protein
MDTDILRNITTFKIEVSRLKNLLSYIGMLCGRDKVMEPNPEKICLLPIIKVWFSLL